MGWAEERARLLADDPPVETEAAQVVAPYPLPVRWGRERGDIAVTDPWGEVHEMSYSEATPVWKAALRKGRVAD
jgi:hypothetical protein